MTPIRLGIVGIGRAGWGMHCDEIDTRKDTFQLAAACDIEPSRLERMARRYDCATYLDIDAFLADPAVELVSIASRSPDHVDHAIRALEAGKYVFLEKPVALNLPDAERLELAAKTHAGQIFFRHNRRFEPAYQHIRQILDQGLLGDVYSIKLRRHGYQRRNDWQTLIDCGGGQLNNWGPHIIDHGLRLLDAPLTETWSDLKNVAAAGDAEDHLKVILKGENGRIVDLEISGGMAIPEPVYAIAGSKGGLTCDEKEIKLKYLDPGNILQDCHALRESPPIEGSFGNTENLKWIEETIPVKPKQPCNTDSIWDHLYSTIRDGVPFPITLEETMQVVRVTCEVKAGTTFEATA